MKNLLTLDLLMSLAAWGTLAMALAGTMLGLLAQLWPTARGARPPSAARATPQPAPRRVRCVRSPSSNRCVDMLAGPRGALAC